MPRPRLVSNEHILEVARACFIQHGHQISTAFIAEQVGLSQSALFKRFGSKENLFLKAMHPPAIPPWVALLEAGPDARPLCVQMVEITVAIDGYFEALLPMMSTLHAARINPHCLISRAQPAPEVGRLAIASWLKRAQAAGRLSPDFDVEVFSYAYMGGLALRRFIHKIAERPLPEPIEGFAERHVRQLLVGIDPQERGDR